MTTHTRILILLGAPGAGKGTQGRLLAEHLRGRHVSVGDLVRAAKARGERLPTDRRTRLVSTPATVKMIRNALEGIDPVEWIVLDGFPRRAGQVEALSDLQHPVAAVGWLEVEFAEAIARMKGRGREGELTPEIGMRHFHHEQSKRELRAALAEAGYPVIDVDANAGVDAVQQRLQAGLSWVIHRTCGQPHLDSA